MSAVDARFMHRALELAERGWGRVRPNPLVGAVVVRDGEVVGEGWHGEYGGAHAEVHALRAAGERARGATIYVTLEPCAHTGKTPPCTDAIRAAGIARLVMAAEDPHPDARGGADRLRRDGVEVVAGVEREAARRQNASFFHALEAETAFVVLKYALSLDARLAARDGEATPVTGAAAREETHRLRAGYAAVMVGRRTVEVDDPLLTVRGDVVPRKPPVRIVVDTEARLPDDARLLRTIEEAPVWVACAEDVPAGRRRRLESAGARVLPVPRGRNGVDLPALLRRLPEQGVESVFCEGGGRLGSALLAADGVQRMHLFYAPRVFGESGVPAFAGAAAPPGRDGWTLARAEVLGDDVHLMLERAAVERV